MDKQTNQTLNGGKGCEAQERKTNLTMSINSIRTKGKQAYEADQPCTAFTSIVVLRVFAGGSLHEFCANKTDRAN